MRFYCKILKHFFWQRFPVASIPWFTEGRLTFKAFVAGFQVRCHVLRTRRHRPQSRIIYFEFALSFSWALGVHVLEDVEWTSEVSIVPLYTSADLHPPIDGALHQDHVVRCTCGTEVFPLAVGLDFCAKENKTKLVRPIIWFIIRFE